MANPEHIAKLKQGVQEWNSWKGALQSASADLAGADLSGGDFAGIDLSGTDLSGANLSRADFHHSDLSGADLTSAALDSADLGKAYLVTSCFYKANLSNALLMGANCAGAQFIHANLDRASLAGAILRDADLTSARINHADLLDVDFTNAILKEADFSQAHFLRTILGNNDLSAVKGLEQAILAGPCTIGIDTFYKSQGQIPDSFLRDAGVPEEVINNWLPVIRAGPAIQWHSCFISHSTKDEEFARRLHGRMREAGLRVWFAPEDLKGGDKLYDQIDRAIQLHDKLLLVLSEHSIQSEWVITEIRKAREVEKKENSRNTFPDSAGRFRHAARLDVLRCRHRQRPRGRGA